MTRRRRETGREWPAHAAFIRGLPCVLAHLPSHQCSGPTRACHWRSAANSGVRLKPADYFLWPGCDKAHAEQHAIGQPAFERKYRLDLRRYTRALAERSPDIAMKTAMREKDSSEPTRGRSPRKTKIGV